MDHGPLPWSERGPYTVATYTPALRGDTPYVETPGNLACRSTQVLAEGVRVDTAPSVRGRKLTRPRGEGARAEGILQFLASASPVPDIVMLSATPPPDPGIVNIPGASGTGFFVVATVNVGVSGSITLSANTGGVTLPVILSMCETNPVTAVCLAPRSGSVTTTIAAGATPTFAVFMRGTGNIAFDPATNGVRVEARDGSNNLVGGTRVVVRTQ